MYHGAPKNDSNTRHDIQCPFIFEFIMILAEFSWVNLNSRERRMQILGRDGLTFTPFINHEKL